MKMSNDEEEDAMLHRISRDVEQRISERERLLSKQALWEAKRIQKQEEQALKMMVGYVKTLVSSSMCAGEDDAADSA